MRRRFGLASSLLCVALAAACGGMEPTSPAEDGAQSDALHAHRPGHRDHDGDDETPPGELPNADVAVSIEGLPPVVASGNFIDYLITVSNVGGQPAAAVQLVDSLPLDTQFVTVSTPQGTCFAPSFGVLTCALGTLDPGASVTVHLTVRALVPAFVTDVAAVTTTSIETNLTNNVATATNQIVLVNHGKGRGRGRHLGWDKQ